MRSPAFAPARRRIKGRASTKNVTMTATGLPGKPRNGTRPTWPSATGRPGLMATRQCLGLGEWLVGRADTRRTDVGAYCQDNQTGKDKPRFHG